MRARWFILVLLVLVALGVLSIRLYAWISRPDAAAQMEIREVVCVGDEVRVLFETSRMYQPMLSHSHKADLVRGWIAIIDLSATGPLRQRCRLVGPLWSIDDPQSFISFAHGVHFTAEDVAAGKARPSCGFDEQSRLLRQVRDESGRLVVEFLDLAGAAPTWARDSIGIEIGAPGEHWTEGRIASRSGRMLVQEEADGGTRTYDLFTGQPRDDAWLTDAFSDWRRRPDLGNSRVWLTDDLKYLVVCPQDRHNKGNGELVEQFSLEGKMHLRADYGLVYTRPDLTPASFQRWKPPTGESMFFMPPHGAISIDGELLLLDVGSSTLALRRRDGSTRSEWTAHAEPRWDAGPPRMAQMSREGNRLLLWGLEDPEEAEPWRNGHLSLIVWDTGSGKLQRFVLELASLFEESGGRFRPAKASAVARSP